MGAVRIYKEDIGDEFPWHVRVGGCASRDSNECNNFCEGVGLHYLCDDHRTFVSVVEHLNSSWSDLGAYLKK